MPRYKLRTLLILLAIGPPALGYAVLLAPINPLGSLFASAWALAFLIAVTALPQTNQTPARISVAQWLVIAAILVCVAALLTPYPYPLLTRE